MALEDFGRARHGVLESLIVLRVLEEHLDEGADVLSQPLGVEHGDVATDHPPGLELLEALGHRAHGEADLFGDLGLSEGRIALDELEDLEVLPVEALGVLQVFQGFLLVSLLVLYVVSLDCQRFFQKKYTNWSSPVEKTRLRIAPGGSLSRGNGKPPISEGWSRPRARGHGNGGPLAGKPDPCRSPPA